MGYVSMGGGGGGGAYMGAVGENNLRGHGEITMGAVVEEERVGAGVGDTG